ncbi:hypothetical protein GCM10010342_54630 [Streptomyces anulatus]|nr:hypothetical protein GCM10010342_54630 [Streptomyces anulatus]
MLAYRSRTAPPADRRSNDVQSPSVSPAYATGSVAVGAVWAVAQDVVHRERAGPVVPAARASVAVAATAAAPAAAAA